MDKTFAEPEQAEDVPVKNEKILDAEEEIMTEEFQRPVEEISELDRQEVTLVRPWSPPELMAVSRNILDAREEIKQLQRPVQKLHFEWPWSYEPPADVVCCMEAREEAREHYAFAERVVERVVKKWCTFVNDTKYTVMITDKDGTRPLKPGKSTINLDIPGFELILVLKLPKKDAKIVFSSSGFNNSSQKISQIFANEINQN